MSLVLRCKRANCALPSTLTNMEVSVPRVCVNTVLTRVQDSGDGGGGGGGGAPEVVLQEVLPKAGLVYSEKGNLGEVLCKPKIMPIKSITLEKLEEMERQAAALHAAAGASTAGASAAAAAAPSRS